MCGKDIDKVIDGGIIAGSPPRVREGQQAEKQKGFMTGITPACAGRTLGHRRSRHRYGDHPRSRGKDSFT